MTLSRFGPDGAAAVATAVATRHHELAGLLGSLGDSELRGPSLLPGWSRLTVVCHLRFGAAATARMTEDILAGRPSAYYPAGRSVQRPQTLAPEDGESPADVVASLAALGRHLTDRWVELTTDQWATPLREPADNIDLTPITLAELALLRLTEVEVHGTDLNIAASPWSDTFVTAALPMRVDWLARRRTNHRAVDRSVRGTWLLAATDGPTFTVRSDMDPEHNADAGPGPGPELHRAAEAGPDAADASVARIQGTTRELVAFLLGRQPLDSLSLSGDRKLARAFLLAFPAP